ncbi:MAG: hypothetical protein BWX81_00217 [Spirochaetes bacterium ADurb.Bin110]|jgi:hypothetical protein|nr:MAG: hypothetical protein BWX81_00217 [Spirochaetes bacterium ADurb.Bin110]
MDGNSINSEKKLVAIDFAIDTIAAFIPVLGPFLKTITSLARIKMNEQSQIKLEKRLLDLEREIEKINNTLGGGQLNYESFLLAPEIIKEYLITDDEERAKDYIRLVAGMFSSGRIEFDSLKEALNIISSLSKNEYRIFQLLPEGYETWNEIFPDKPYQNDKDGWIAALNKLKSKYLIDIKLPLYPGSVNTEIRFSDDEEVSLTNYGKRIIETIKNCEQT